MRKSLLILVTIVSFTSICAHDALARTMRVKIQGEQGLRHFLRRSDCERLHLFVRVCVLSRKNGTYAEPAWAVWTRDGP